MLTRGSIDVGIVANSATGWGFIGEISSQRLRPYTAGFAAASTCVAGIIMNVLTPYMVNSNQWNWGLKTGWFYAGVGLPFTAAMWFLIPETSKYVMPIPLGENVRLTIYTVDLRPNSTSYLREKSARGNSIKLRQSHSA